MLSIELDQTSEPPVDTVMDSVEAATPHQGLGSNHWILDSGATNHVTGIASLFINYRQLQPGERAIKVADGRYIDVAGMGDIIIAFDNGNKIIL